MSESLKIEKIGCSVKIKLYDGSWFPAQIFLNRYTLEHQGPEHVFDLLNLPDRYLPVRDPAGKIRFLNKRRLLQVILPREAGMRELDPGGVLTPLIRFVKANVSLISGEFLRGYLPVELPRETGERTLDWLNQRGEFFPLLTDEWLIYIQHRGVLWIEEIDETDTNPGVG